MKFYSKSNNWEKKCLSEWPVVYSVISATHCISSSLLSCLKCNLWDGSFAFFLSFCKILKQTDISVSNFLEVGKGQIFFCSCFLYFNILETFSCVWTVFVLKSFKLYNKFCQMEEKLATTPAADLCWPRCGPWPIASRLRAASWKFRLSSCPGLVSSSLHMGTIIVTCPGLTCYLRGNHLAALINLRVWSTKLGVGDDNGPYRPREYRSF